VSVTEQLCLSLLHKCKTLKIVKQIHAITCKTGLDTDRIVAGKLLLHCAVSISDALDYARRLFHHFPDPDVFMFNSIIRGFAESNTPRNSLVAFVEMRRRACVLDSFSFAFVLKGAANYGCLRGELELAKEVFLEMPVKDDVSWSSMIAGFAQNGCFDEAFGFFRKLLWVGMRPNEVSLTGVLSACAQAGAFEFGKILQGFLEKAGFLWMISVNNALMDTYCKCGNVGMARLVFERMLENKSIVSWTTMIAGLAMHGNGEEAIQLFHDMEASGIRPDGVTFISILYACSHAGLIEQGCKYFSKMKDVYGIEPVIEHYGCMVDLYGRAGKLQKVYDFVCQMPISPTAIIWRTLLGACSIHGNVKLGEQVKERLSELEPSDSGDHVLLSNIYAIAGKWKDVATVRRSMTDQKIKKTPGWSMIEVDKIMYTFVAGGKQDKITEEAYEKLREIISKLRIEGGYVPEVGSVLHDIEEEEKEDSVSRHSEKLALAFGMARLCEGRVIRIVKNLRVCRDCHAVMKLISRVYRLEILVRDRSRFHSFRDGSCSCRDYW
ncbi:pentatricopeptide repeat-containing protein, partial [Quercus suber]